MGDVVITAEPTPNPNAMKFTASRPLTAGPAKSFYNAEAAQADPVAARIFGVGGVTAVMILGDFCSVNKEASADWDEICPRVQEILREAYG